MPKVSSSINIVCLKTSFVQSDTDGCIYRVLLLQSNQMLLVNCQNKGMPTWVPMQKASAYRIVKDTFVSPELNDLTPVQRRKAIERFTMISAAVSVMAVLLFRRSDGGSEQSVKSALSARIKDGDALIHNRRSPLKFCHGDLLVSIC